MGKKVMGKKVIDSSSKLSEVSGSKDALPVVLPGEPEFGIPHLYENRYKP
jgi:hypothetical protein